MRSVSYRQIAPVLLDRLSHGGVFLTVLDEGGKPNTMTMGWGSIGFYWGKPVLTAPVRLSRYTYKGLCKNKEFSLSIPVDAELSRELQFAGTVSGREHDKFAEAPLSAQPARTVACPVVGECRLHIECKLLLSQPLTQDGMGPEVARLYTDGDVHVLFFGEITACYYGDD